MIDVLRTADGRLLVDNPNKHPTNAETYLSAKFPGEERYSLVYHRGQYRTWTGTHWRTLHTDMLESDIYAEFSRAQYMKEIDDPNNPGQKMDILVEYPISDAKLRELVKAIKLRVIVNPDIDTPVWLDEAGKPDLSMPDPHDIITCANVLLDARTRATADHTPRFLNQFATSYDYDVAAPEPSRWVKFLADLWPEDQQSIDTLQEMFGYLLTTRTDLQKMLMMIGPPRSGKGTIIRVLTAMLGGGVGSVSLADLNQRFGLAEVANKQVAIMQDARFRSRDDGIAVERLLSIIGEDPVSVEQKNKDIYTGKLPTRFVLVSNEIPKMQDESGALQSRILMLRMLHTVPEGRRDPQLFNRLAEELSGILNWSLAGLERLNARGHFVQPESAAEDVDFMSKLSAPTAGFVEEVCELGADFTVSKRDLYRIYTQWCADTGSLRMSEPIFARNLYASAPGVRAKRLRTIDPATNGRMQVYSGVKLSTVGEYLLKSLPMEWRPQGEPPAEEPDLPPI